MPASVSSIAFAFVLGFIGYLPLGNINLSVVQVAVSRTARVLWSFIFFIAVMEFIYCVACLRGINFLLHQPGWILVLKWTAVALFFVLGMFSLLHKPDSSKASSVGIKRGVFIALFNPMQAPYWLVWGVYMMENNLLAPGWLPLFLFAIITALGTASVLWLYAVGGKTLITKLKLSGETLNRIIGIMFLALAAWQFFKLVLEK
jgi:threonine/homoserine/homoserine lactone efflux protein